MTALAHGRTQLPLVLSASKTWVGHAEPGAGINGLLHAVRTLVHHEQLALMHLRQLSNHVEQALGTSTCMAPRQGAPMPVTAPLHVGISSFAYSGSNAHAILSCPQPNAALNVAKPVAWNKQSLWCVSLPGPWSLSCSHVSQQSLVTFHAKVPVAARLPSTAPMVAWSALWSEMLLSACTLVSGKAGTVLTNLTTPTAAASMLDTVYTIDVDIANGSVALRTADNAVVKGDVVITGKDQQTASGQLLAHQTTPHKSPCSAMVCAPVDVFAHQKAVAACQLLLLGGGSSIHHVFSTWACSEQGAHHDMSSSAAAVGDSVEVNGDVAVQAHVTVAKQPPHMHLLYCAEPLVYAGMWFCYQTVHSLFAHSSNTQKSGAEASCTHNDYVQHIHTLPSMLQLLQDASAHATDSHPLRATLYAPQQRMMHGLLASAAREGTLVHAHMYGHSLEVPHIGDSTFDSQHHYLLQTPMLRPVATKHNSTPPPCWDTVLITGASGYLGNLVARWVVHDSDEVHTNLMLASRSTVPDLYTLSMRTHGLVQHVKMDVASDADWYQSCLLERVDAVMHAAGVLDDATLPNVTVQQARHVAAGKLGAVGQLHELASSQPVQRMTLFSSVSALLGSPGQVCIHVMRSQLSHITVCHITSLAITVGVCSSQWHDGHLRRAIPCSRCFMHFGAAGSMAWWWHGLVLHCCTCPACWLTHAHSCRGVGWSCHAFVNRCAACCCSDSL